MNKPNQANSADAKSRAADLHRYKLMKMKCPRDKNKLQHKEIEGLSFRFCRLCNGIWITLNSFPELLKANEKIDFLRSQYPAIQKKDQGFVPLCPVDSKPTLVLQKFDGIKTYICTWHQSIWIDGGQIDSIIKNYRKKNCFKTAKKEGMSALDVIHCVDATYYWSHIIEGIVNLFK